MTWRHALLALCLMASAPMAMADLGAQSAGEPDITGNWAFKSYTYDACEFGGVASLVPTEEEDTYTCELTARQFCPSIEWVVRQSCIAHRTGDRLVIRSQIEEFITGPETASYWPDNFILKIQTGDRMTGSLISHGTHATEFTRQVEGIS